MLAPVLSKRFPVSKLLWHRFMACVALLFWLLSSSAGVHAHFGQVGHHGPAADQHSAQGHDTGHSGHATHAQHARHEAVLSVYSLLDDAHEQQHANGQQVDTGLEQLQSAVGKPGSKLDLSLLPLVPSQHNPGFAALPSRFFVSSPPLKPPRHGSSAPPPLRAPPVNPA